MENDLHNHRRIIKAAPPPGPIIRYELTNPSPTTHVQAEPSNFKEIVQMLTGKSETTSRAHNPKPPINTLSIKRSSSGGIKIYERRNSFMINQLHSTGAAAAGNSEALSARLVSPRTHDFQAFLLSPDTTLIQEPSGRSNTASPSNVQVILDQDAEEKALKEKLFYLLPPPRATAPENRELLPLFPMRPSEGGSE